MGQEMPQSASKWQDQIICEECDLMNEAERRRDGALQTLRVAFIALRDCLASVKETASLRFAWQRIGSAAFATLCRELALL
jgi:hypothetical protein